MIINLYSLIIRINTNILYYFVYYIRLIILKSNIFLNTFASKILNIKIIIIYKKNLFFYREIIKNIDCEITT